MRTVGALSTSVLGGFRQRSDLGPAWTVIGWNFIAVGRFSMTSTCDMAMADEPWCRLSFGRVGSDMGVVV